jgi:hypothetical protein
MHMSDLQATSEVKSFDSVKPLKPIVENPKRRHYQQKRKNKINLP